MKRSQSTSLAVALLMATLACAPAQAPQQVEPAVEATRVAILTAMPIELAPFLEVAEVTERQVINGRTHHLGVLEGVDVVMAAFGISMVNATMGAQLVIDRFDVEAIVVAGIAGGASPEIRIGDVAVPERWVQYQEHVFTDAARAGWRRGWRNEDLGSYGMMYPQRVWATNPDIDPDAEHLKLWFETAPALLRVAEDMAADVVLERCTPGGECVEHDPTLRIGGNGASGPTFVDDAAYREWVWEVFAPEGFDMETAAIGHVAYANGVPYIGVRAISDMAGANPNENRVESFAPVAARNAASVVRALLRNWPADPAAD